MRRGINVGNVLDRDAPPERLHTVTDDMLSAIVDAGFDTVRIPVRWAVHAGSAPSFTIDPSFCALVDDAIDRALGCNLHVIVNAHHDLQLNADPDSAEPRFLAGWTQIAARYADRSDRLALELLNEPDGELTVPRWNHLLRRALAAVRDNNPARTVLIGPGSANTLADLERLDLPEDDHVVATVHYYEPFRFTHQGAPWLPELSGRTGAGWGAPTEVAAVRADLVGLAAWAAERRVPVFVGEFGTYQAAAIQHRAAWTSTVRRQLDELGIGWCYWDFASDFGAFDPVGRAWRMPLYDALLAP